MPDKMREVGILKTLWNKDKDGKWVIGGFMPLMLRPKAGCEPDFFQFKSILEKPSDRPMTYDSYGSLTTFGYTDFLVKQSIVPVIAWVDGDAFIRCIGTAFMVSCTGYLITACHVFLDPYDRKQATVAREDNAIKFPDGMRFGVLIPLSPATGRIGSIFYPFQDCRCWGQWKDSPLPHLEPTFEMLTDIAICKISLLPDGAGHQPLSLSLNSFTKGERAMAIGYAEMADIPIEVRGGTPTVPEFKQDLYVSLGPANNVFPNNHNEKVVFAPGPCFEFLAKIPGKMSGAPIFGADGSVVRGVVSTSSEVSKHAYGAMVSPAMQLSLGANTTLRTLMDSGNEGIPIVRGAGL
ncbi:MAG TPA: trypsin-like peptidase domain-containing protein [Candidatus Acidoferrum sp.]|jgi:hypothetical protein|nr:trypsin-like peptidase domain-containing protein [Candidatus Acidoferrum sp.]